MGVLGWVGERLDGGFLGGGNGRVVLLQVMVVVVVVHVVMVLVVLLVAHVQQVRSVMAYRPCRCARRRLARKPPPTLSPEHGSFVRSVPARSGLVACRWL